MVENLREIALKAYEAIFSNHETVEIEGRIYHMDYTNNQNLRKFSIEGLNFIEQNPDKGSSWAKMAREGHRILWVMKGRGYIAQVRDGVFHELEKNR
jgi:hypothetical protein